MAGTEIVKRSSDLVEPLQTSGENYVGTFTLQQSVGWPRYNFYVDADMDVFLTLKITISSAVGSMFSAGSVIVM